MFNWFSKTDDVLMDRVNQYREVMPVVMDFVDACSDAVNDDGKVSRKDSQILMKQYWQVIKAVQKN